MRDDVQELLKNAQIRDLNDLSGIISIMGNTFKLKSAEIDEALSIVISRINPDMALHWIHQSEFIFHLSLKGLDNFKLKLYIHATNERSYPEDYPADIRALIMLSGLSREDGIIASKIIYGLLLDPTFRKVFKNDVQFVPFFVNDLYDMLSTQIQSECKDEKLVSELLELLEICKQRQIDPKMADTELKKIFTYNDPLDPEQEDILAIQKFLANTSDDSDIMRQLHKLELELEKRAGNRYDPNKKLLKDYREGEPYKHDKLLSGFLKQWAEDNGFSGYGRLKGVVSSEAFFGVLKKGGLFKDPAFRGDLHGDFTHFLQWYLITTWNGEDPKHPKLNCHPARVLGWIGENEKSREWGNTFEVNPSRCLYKPTRLDFRNVDELHKFLNSEKCPFPVLHQLNKGRSAKGSTRANLDDGLTFEPFKKP